LLGGWVRIIGFGVAAANLDGPLVCRMFNRAITGQTTPKYLSSDNGSHQTAPSATQSGMFPYIMEE